MTHDFCNCHIWIIEISCTLNGGSQYKANIKIVCIFNIEMFSIWKTFDLIRSTSYMISGPVRQWLTLAFDLGQTMPVQVCIVTSGPHQKSITASNVIDTDARQQHYSKPHPLFVLLTSPTLFFSLNSIKWQWG